MDDLLSLWRSPIDKLAVAEAHKLAARQPRCDYTIDQLPNTTNPQGNDLLALWQAQTNNTVSVALSVLAAYFGNSGPGGITNATDLSGLTIYNYGAFNGLPSNVAATNNAAMVNMFAKMQANNNGVGGGLGIFQGNEYNIDSQPLAQGGYVVPSQTVMLGTGAVSGSNNSLMKGTFLLSAASTSVPNIFWSVAPGVHSSGGTVIKNIGFACTVGSNPNTLILAMNGWHPVAEDCVFFRCPQVAQFFGLAGGLYRCTVDYAVTQAQGPNGGSTPATAIVQIQLHEPQTYVDRCEMQQTPISSGGPTNIACIQPLGGPGARHQSISNNHIVDYTWGVTIAANGGSGTNWHLTIFNNEMACFSSCLYFSFDSATGGNADLTDVKVIGNTLWQSANSTDNAHDVVMIDPTFGNSLVITFTNNSIFDSLRDGVRIAGGSVKFIGDQIGGNTNANVNITGASQPVNNVSFDGVTFGGAFHSSPNNFKSQYGLQVNLANLASTSVISVNGCTFRSDIVTAAVNAINGPIPAGAEFRITNSPGYNDQKTTVSTNPLDVYPSGTTGAGPFVSAADLGYFGPSFVSFQASPAIQFRVGTTGVTSQSTTWGMAYLAPGQKIQFGGAPLLIAWIGY